MVKKCDPAIFLNQIKNLLASSIFVNLLILALILFAAQRVCAQTNVYSPFTSYNSSPFGINSGATYSNDYFSSSSYALPSLNSFSSYPSASGYSAYPGASGYSAYPSASAYSAYPGASGYSAYPSSSAYSAYPSSSGYSAQNSLLYPNTFGSTTQNIYYPSTSTGSYYNTQNAYTAAQNSYYSPGAAGAASPYTTQSAYSTQGSFYYPSSGFAQTNSYNTANTYNAANSYYPTSNTYNPYGTSYYSNATTYSPSAGGYVINSTSSITGTWIGTWVRNFSSTGAPTSQSGSNSSSSHNMNSSSSNSNSSMSGSSTRFSAEDIKIELAQSTSSVNGTVTFFEDTVINAIPVSGTLINGVLDLYGTTGTAADPYGLQITANIDVTVEDANIQGAYTLTNTITNTNIELGTFTVER